MKAWGGRFADAQDPLAADYGRSVDIDRELALDDIQGSIAHVRGLWRARLLAPAEVAAIIEGLKSIEADIRAGTFTWDPDLEDVHLNMEMALTERIGPVAGKLHTARSRNDQVATDLRLWLRRRVGELDRAFVGLERALVALGQREVDTVMPGHTHAQPAQPVLFAHHLLAYVEMLERDRARFRDMLARADVSPLGSGALAGVGHPIDRQAVGSELGFHDVSHNSIDATGDRDFVAEAISSAALAMTHLSRLAEEIVWWSNPRFGFVRPSDAFSTGSSMMPNKRNPDPAELVRGRTSRVIGHATQALSLLKGLPAGYQRDLQEDKPALFDALAVLESSLRVMAGLLASLVVDRDLMRTAASEGYTTATAVADALVEDGVTFREAHHAVGRLVAEAEGRGLALDELDDASIAESLASSEDPIARRLALNGTTGDRIRAAAGLEEAIARFDVIGGTAPRRVRVELEAAAARLGEVDQPDAQEAEA